MLTRARRGETEQLLQFIHKRIQTVITTTDIHDFENMQGVQFIQCQEGTSIMESLEMCLAGGLHELGLLEQFKLNTLIHHWRDVVGPIYAGHTRIIDIKPPKIVLSADNSQWMQEVKMDQKRIPQGH